MQWEWFQTLTLKEWREKWSRVPHFTANFCDPAWKGEENQGEGCDTAIGQVAIFKRGEFQDYVLLEGIASNELVSDEGAEEQCRMMRRWQSPYYIIEQAGDKPHIGMMRQIGKNQSPPMFPKFIDIKGYSKRAKNARISAVAGAARMGHFYILEGIDKKFIEALRLQVDEYPGCRKRDILDMLGNAFADEVLNKWIPMSHTPAEIDLLDRAAHHARVITRYTGLPEVRYH
jgi:hypothetical protein